MTLKKYLCVGIFFTVLFNSSNALGLRFALKRGAWVKRPVLIFIRDWDGLQIWGNSRDICIPLFRLETFDPMGFWLEFKKKNYELSKLNELGRPMTFYLNDIACNKKIKNFTRFEIVHFPEYKEEVKKPEKVSNKETIIRFSGKMRPLVWDTKKLYPDKISLWPKKYRALFQTKNIMVRTAEIKVPFVRAAFMSEKWHIRKLWKGKLNKNLELNYFLSTVPSHIEEFGDTWMVYLKAKMPEGTDKPKIYLSRDLPRGQWQMILGLHENFAHQKVPKIYKPKKLDPKEYSKNTQEKWKRVDRQRWKFKPGWFKRGKLSIDGQEMTWIEDQIAIYKFKGGEPVLHLLYEDGTGYQYKEVLHIDWQKKKPKTHVYKPVQLKLGVNRWRYHHISLK